MAENCVKKKILATFLILSCSIPWTFSTLLNDKELNSCLYSSPGGESAEDFSNIVLRYRHNAKSQIKRARRDTSVVSDSQVTKNASNSEIVSTSATTVATSSVTTSTTVSISIATSPESNSIATENDDTKNRGWQGPPESVLKEVDVTESKINETLKSHIEKENWKENEDHYKYYNSTFISFNSSWIDLEEWNRTNPGIVYQHSMLSKSYRRAATISLKFKFPFYGHLVENITIATGGFLYTGDYVHSWLAATQYIAPLMANFDTSQDENANVKYADNGTTLVVEWGNVYLQGREGTSMEGPFTFQAILHRNGDIVFAYKTIPVSIMTIADEEHPVKVGLSDAYIIERTIFFVRRKTIYEYHRVNMKGKEIANYTAIYLRALPRCNMKKSCKECLALTVREEGQDIQCMWCSSAGLCSDGYDRNKQNWLKQDCDKKNHFVKGDPETCDNTPPESGIHSHDYNPSYTIDDDHRHFDRNSGSGNPNDKESEHFTDSKSNVHHTGVAVLTVVIILILTTCGWCLYAYFFPHTCSGQLLIKYRPSRWHWRRGEPRYTAASIHM